MTVSGWATAVVRGDVTGGTGARVGVRVVRVGDGVERVGEGERVVRVADGERVVVRVGEGVPVMVWVVFRPVAGGALVEGVSEALLGEAFRSTSSGTAIKAAMTRNTAAMTTLGNCIALSRIAARSLGGKRR